MKKGLKKKLDARLLESGPDEAEVSATAPSPFFMVAKQSIIQTKNNHLEGMKEDYLYHLGLTKSDAVDFAHVQYVCMGGFDERMIKFAHQLGAAMGLPEEDIISVGIHKRYVLYLVGPVLICSHGMGGPSTSILLHEVAKLLKYANADAQWIRMGTSGGIGVEEGSLVVTKQPLNSDLEPFHESIILGERVRRATNFDQELCSKLYHAAKKAAKAKVEIGLTISCYDFYEGQLRSDGAICEFSEVEKKAFLEDIQKKGVRNMEMDSVQFGAFCNTIGVRAGMMCVTLVNRFERDQISDDPQVLDDYEQRLIDSMIVFITDNIK